MANYGDKLNVWWDYVQSDSLEVKARYMLRNWEGMGSTIDALLGFFREKKMLWEGKNGCTFAILETPIVFRVDPNTPSIHGPLNGVESICVCG